MGSKIKLLVLDIDGTINGSSNQVNAPVKAAVKAAQAQGVKVAIATGRMYRSALRFHREIGADCPLISYQGAFIKDPEADKLVGHWPVEVPLALALIDHFSQFDFSDRLSVHLYLDDCLYVKEITPDSAIYAERSGVEPIAVGNLQEFLKTNAHNPPTKILALTDHPEPINYMFDTLIQQFSPQQLYLTKSQATFFEATNPIANKGTAVKYLAEKILGLDASAVMTVGDNFNDVEMIQYAGVGVAMGNAPLGLQKLADWVAPDVEQDGVVAAIEQFILV
ncbi:HAD-superfamily hydrolase, subfamily IIB [Synechococcus sp. PCC 7502]|uniref:Cof-type HAD-IIB family hydrolase n=1 Tax=Synechococcus sp. PCC 7502 TaxID=1173263 RepID=UPI00029FD0B7|nr:Cof-type HAD-IIB family hydrolase [Synechococcus sp. PCC 7502]AFY74541.1 HAD-superfamily hydrolase, subfamily IIB [Synechococcus sp. PCC 7502]